MISLISSSARHRTQFVSANTTTSFFSHFPFSYEELHSPSHIYLVQQVCFFCLYGNVRKRKGKSKDEGAAWYFSLQRMCYQLDSKFKKTKNRIAFLK